MFRLLLFVCIFFTGGTDAIAQSEPSLTIQYDEARDAMVLDSSLDIAAPPATIWNVITDCERAPKFVPNMESCRIVSRGPNGSDVHETVMNYVIVPRIRTTTRMDREPFRRMSYTRIAGDMRIADITLDLEPLDGGAATRLRYPSVFALNCFVPQILLRFAAERDIPALMKGIERESLADAAKRPPTANGTGATPGTKQ